MATKRKHNVDVHIIVQERGDPSAVANRAYGRISNERGSFLWHAFLVDKEWTVGFDLHMTPGEQRAILAAIKAKVVGPHYQTTALVIR